MHAGCAAARAPHAHLLLCTAQVAAATSMRQVLTWDGRCGHCAGLRGSRCWGCCWDWGSATLLCLQGGCQLLSWWGCWLHRAACRGWERGGLLLRTGNLCSVHVRIEADAAPCGHHAAGGWSSGALVLICVCICCCCVCIWLLVQNHCALA